MSRPVSRPVSRPAHGHTPAIVQYSVPMPQREAGSTADTEQLDEVDLAWQRRRGSLGPLVLGVVGITLSPLLLGLVFGPIAVRAGLDRWRSGLRRPVIAVGVASGLVSIVLSVMGALLWGSVLATVLLGRDALREAERWRGREVEPVAVAFSGGPEVSLRPPEGKSRLVLLAVDVGQQPSRQAVEAIARQTPDSASLVLVDRSRGGEPIEQWLSRAGINASVIPSSAPLPPPLDAIAALPLLVSIDRSGRIEGALIGVRPAGEYSKLLEGQMALPPVRGR